MLVVVCMGLVTLIGIAFMVLGISLLNPAYLVVSCILFGCMGLAYVVGTFIYVYNS